MAKKLSTTTKGKAVWPHLHAPDTKFDEAGIYSTKLELSTEDGAELKDAIDSAMQDSLKDAMAAEEDPKKKKKIKLADAPYAEDDEAGTVTFNFKMTASGTVKKTGKTFTQQPALFDAKLKPIPDGTRIGGGSTIRVSYEIAPFFTALVGAGVTLRLKGVQVLDLVEFSRDGTSFGFESDEGYEAQAAEQAAGKAAEQAAGKAAGFDAEEGEDEQAEVMAKQAAKPMPKAATSGKAADDF